MNFMRWRYAYLALSALVIVPGLFSLVFSGLKPSIDFTGGTLWEIKGAKLELSKETTEADLKESFPLTSLQSSGPGQYILRGKLINDEQRLNSQHLLQNKYGAFEQLRFESVGPTLGKELLQKTLTAALVAATLITLYVARQFKEIKYGLCAVLAMLHDSLVLVGIFSLLGWRWGVEVDVLFVTALMTTLSFSVHDTIVVYDRIREVKKLRPGLSFEAVINLSVLQTLSRSLNNSLTIIVMLLALVLLGGQNTRWFSTALLIGAVTGTYSSTFTAAPLLLLWEDLKGWRKR